MAKEHFNGGYFSESVRAEAERVRQLPDEEKRAFFADVFNETHTFAERLQANPRFNSERSGIELSAEGLGFIGIDLTYCSAEEAAAEDTNPYRGILVTVDSFSPTPRTKSEWVNAPGDELGLETHSPTMVTLDHEIPHWEEHVFADLDGMLDETQYDIDQELLRLLDARETLRVLGGEALSLATRDELLAA